MNIKFLLLFPILLSLLMPAGCTSNVDLNSSLYTEPNPETYVSLMPIVREYFYLYKQTVLTGDADLLFERYPELETGTDLEKGINTEAHHIASMQSLAPFDGNIHPEYYEQIKIKGAYTDLEILVHGLELYLWQDEDGSYQESGGEFKVVLFVRKEGDTWQIYQTDQVTLSEWKDAEF